jgi:phosphate:Na+ symporter
VLGNEELVNSMQKEITGYLTKITEHDLSEAQGTRVMALMHAVNDIERVGDHATNLVELIQIKDDKRLKLNDGTQDDLKAEFAHVLATLDEAMSALRDYDVDRARHVKGLHVPEYRSAECPRTGSSGRRRRGGPVHQSGTYL